LKEEARVYYVASTRAKEELSRMGRDGLPIMKLMSCANERKRWISHFYKSPHRFVEIGLNNDINSLSFVNQVLFPNEQDAIENQNYLWDNIYQQPTQISIKKKRIEKENHFYIYHTNDSDENVRVGEMSKWFRIDLACVLRKLHNGKRFMYPLFMDGINVTAVVTELLPAYPENVHTVFRKSGFCLGIRIKGMGYLTKVNRYG